ncbi:hybrid sensor histidine kinase/response regulator [Polyangium sp. 6x1]|uniref:response regulator n=1 Tax=Polyangium sp. 6x1 TaxID=3042689 RepID=UPI0024826FA1|nr:hybrid sensor histidine kinase/response regulator [Polyangium sp. 6x1]MDI1447746.1 hybrid sensor histidine kinase/response regulator [Polyangium sp. 6x1]
MALDDAAFEALCETLRNEAVEQVERIGTALLLVERGAEGTAREQLIDEAFRQAHNMKGAASSLGFTHTARLAHAIESVLASLRAMDYERTPEVFDTLNAGLSTVHHALRVDPNPDPDLVIMEAIEGLEAVLLASKPSPGVPLPAPPPPPVVRPADGITVATRSRSPQSILRQHRAAAEAAAPSRNVSAGYNEPKTKHSEPPPHPLASSPLVSSHYDAAPIPAGFGPPPVAFSPPAVGPYGPPTGYVARAEIGGITPPPAPVLSPGTSSGSAPGTSAGSPGTSAGAAVAAARSMAAGGSERGPNPTGQLPKIPNAAAPLRSSTEETLRVSMKKLSALMAQVGELLAARVRTDQRLAELRAVLSAEEERLKAQTAIRAMVRDEAPAKLEGWSERLVEVQNEDLEHERLLVRRLREIVRAFEADALQSTILSGQLQEDIRRIQTFPLASVLEPLPRAVRNMARESGKMVDLVITGAELELDKKVLEELRDPLYHLLRNAIDHGCEQPGIRTAAGKPSRGTIRIRAEHRGDVVTITVSDDGPGVDIAGVRRAAIASGLATALEAAEMPEHRVLELLFAPGLTTRTEVGELSGRGVGLDAVRTNIERLHGTVTVESRQGVGTSFVIVLPLTIYVVHSLLLRIGEEQFAMPISSIQRILRISATDVLEVERTHAIVVDGRPIALVPLATLLGLPVELPPPPERIPVLVIGIGETRCALAVREIVSDQTVLAKNLEPPLVRVRNIAGATILGDGRVVLMLNPIDLLRSASGRDADRFRALLPRVENRPKPRLLLVDDSFTTRALERSVLEVAGFDVVAVADGNEALSALELETFDIVVSDVSMPEMSGLELCSNIRQNDRLRRLPVVLVTSLGSDDDRRAGLAVGADAYIVKSEFDHEVFVKTVNELVGRA